MESHSGHVPVRCRRTADRRNRRITEYPKRGAGRCPFFMLFSVLLAGSVSAVWRQQIGQALQAMLNATVMVQTRTTFVVIVRIVVIVFLLCGNGCGQKFGDCLRRKPLAELYHGGGSEGAFAGVRSQTDKKLQVGVLTDVTGHPLVAAPQSLLDHEGAEGNADRMCRVAIVHKALCIGLLGHILGNQGCQLAKGELILF